jgi:hypothetical protein
MEMGLEARNPRVDISGETGAGKMVKKATILALMLLALLALPAPRASAQSFDLTVLPAKNEITADPGTTSELSITVRNHAPQAMDIKVYPMDYYITPDNQFLFEEPGHYTYSCATWLRFDRETISMGPNSEAQLPVRVEVPPDAEPGGHYAVVFFEKVLTPEEIATGAQLAPRVGALILLTVPGEIVREGVIRSFSVKSDFLSLWGPSQDKKEGFPVRSLRYRLEVENPGNVHITVKAFMSYRPSLGFGRGEVELGEMTILPGTVRYFEGYLPDPPALGVYRAEARILYGKDLFTFDIEKRASAGFWVVPLLWILILCALAAALYLLARLLRERLPWRIRLEKR